MGMQHQLGLSVHSVKGGNLHPGGTLSPAPDQLLRNAGQERKHEPGLHFKEFEFLHKIMHPSTTQMPSQASGARG
ncbi:hypothetical protein HYQ45_010684 [Verticillium longisporum]|uniref:Uncharacterized protein n=1 Tax=Verticillium longisporum TaxID=100787 RepID=A0A8I2ZG12_VERLO|nr:hypothetical protein HYQ45_010684 [Verticillium longisporum]